MAIYRKGQVSLDAQGYLTGYNTKWKASLTLIRPGATIIIASNPVIYGVVSEVISDTSIRLINFGKATAAKSDYVILLHDSLTVDGLAQDVAETLRYYQGKETEFAHFIEVIKGLDYEKLEALIQRIKHESEEFEKNLAEIDKRVEQTKTYANQAQQSAHDAAARKDEVSILHTQTENLKNQAAQQVTAAAQQVALAKEEVRLAKAEVQKAEGEAVKANKEFIKAKAEATLAQEIVAGAKLEVVNEARAEVERARSEADRAQGVVDNAKQEIREEVQVQVDNATEQADRAKREADRAQDLADSFDADRVMLKSKNLSDVDDLEVARTNIKVDRLVQDANMTRVKASDGKAELRIGFDDWYVYRDSHDSEAGYIALPVKGGGTGGTTPLEAREGLELERFRQHTQRTEMATANGEYRLFVGDEGDWGVLNKQSEHVVLPVRAGGTGAKDAATARKNIGLDRVVQDSNMTRIKSSDGKTELRLGFDDWYVFRDSQDSERGYIALGVQGGGTGATDAPGARENLGVGRLIQSANETLLESPNKKKKLVLSDGYWGFFDYGANKYVPLALGAGGTGSSDAAGARNNLEVLYRRRTSLGRSDNLNSIFGFDKAGIYYNAANANATTANNYPIQQAGVLVVQCSQANGVNQTMQYYYPFAREDIYFARAYNFAGGSDWQWGGWKEYASLQNMATRIISVGGIKTTGGLEIDHASDGAEPSPSVVARRRKSDNSIIVSSEMRANQNGSVEWIKRDASGSPRSVGMTADNYFTFSGVTPAPNSMEIGKYAANNAAYIDFHYSAKYDYDARIICDGMNRDQSGGGNLRLYCGYLELKSMSRALIQDQGATVIGNGASIIMQPKDASQACYLLGRNNEAVNEWYIGRGGADQNVSFHSYSHGTTMQLRSGDIYFSKDITTASGRNIVVNGNSIYVDGASGTNNTHLWFRNSSKKNRAVIYTSDSQVLQLRSDNANTGAGGQALSIYGATGECKAVKFTATSDERAKFWIKPVTGALDKICALRGVTYSMHTTIQNTVRNAGVIAQDVQKVLPEAVSVSETGSTIDKQCRQVENPLSLDYNALSALYVEAFKELKAENDDLKAQVSNLQSQIDQIMAMLNSK